MTPTPLCDRPAGARSLSSLLAATLVLVLVPLASLHATLRPASAADAPSVPASASAAWLTGLLTDGERMVRRDLAIDDVDLTLDVLLGLAASDAAGDVQRRMLAWFAREIGTHVGTASDAVHVAVTAKGALAAMALGADPRAVGGEDLVALLVGRVGDDGRVSDRGALGDLSSTASQSFAVLALARAEVDEATVRSASDLLASVACEDGGFPDELVSATCASSLTATALAVQALATVGGHDAAVRAGAAAIAARLDATAFDEDLPQGWQLGLAAQALRAAGDLPRAATVTEGLLAALDGCDGQASGALLDPSDPVRATIGALLAASGATLATLDGTASTQDAPPLDCTPADAREDDGGAVAAPSPSAGSDTGVDDGSSRRSRAVPAFVAALLLVALLGAGVPALRRMRRDR
jgi:hypothetical protein